AKPEEPSWRSPWGTGRPGWHIECSAMSARLLGQVFDIHGGGTDLIFPHHENEIAQSAGISGTTPARYWIHNGLVNMGAEKMSKSRGNGPSLFDLLDQYPADALRLLVLSKRYRRPLAYSARAAHTAVCQLKRLQSFFDGLPASGSRREEVDQGGTLLWEQFCSAMDDDFNFPQALAVIFSGIKSCRRMPGNQALYGDLIKMSRIVFGLSLEPIAGGRVAPSSFHRPSEAV
ncbi:MAG: class I tRNA ligase family protein, partial [Desulfosarcinaceae bacterium]